MSLCLWVHYQVEIQPVNRGMYRDGHYKQKECTGTDITIERNVMLRNIWGTDITSERNVQGQTLQLRGM